MESSALEACDFNCIAWFLPTALSRFFSCTDELADRWIEWLKCRCLVSLTLSSSYLYLSVYVSTILVHFIMQSLYRNDYGSTEPEGWVLHLLTGISGLGSPVTWVTWVTIFTVFPGKFHLHPLVQPPAPLTRGSLTFKDEHKNMLLNISSLNYKVILFYYISGISLLILHLDLLLLYHNKFHPSSWKSYWTLLLLYEGNEGPLWKSYLKIWVKGIEMWKTKLPMRTERVAFKPRSWHDSVTHFPLVPPGPCMEMGRVPTAKTGRAN